MNSVMHLAFGFLGVATLGLLVSHSGQAVQLAQGTAGAFAGLLNTVMLNNQYGNSFSGT
jgi:hypothetical protein